MIIGHLIPAGTGIERYRRAELVYDEEEEEVPVVEPEAKETIADIFKENA